jgi:uncharacterized RDD family membrane protein YckC
MSDPTAPPPRPPGTTADDPSPRGFGSAADKRSLKRRAIVFCVGLMVLQIILPVALMIAMFASMLSSDTGESIDVTRGAFWEGSLWLVEQPPHRFHRLNADGPVDPHRLLRWSPEKGGEPEHAKLPEVAIPSLVVVGDALWAVGDDRCVVMTPRKLDVRSLTVRLGDEMTPLFELDGAPAIVAAAEGATELELYRLDANGAWTPDPRFDVGARGNPDDSGFAVIVPDGGTLHVFTTRDRRIVHRAGIDGYTDAPSSEWEELPGGDGEPVAWTAARIGGETAVFVARRENWDVVVEETRLSPSGAWTPVTPFYLGQVSDLGVYGPGERGRFFIAAKGDSGAVAIHEVAGAEVIRTSEIAKSPMEPFMRLNALSSWITVIAMAATPLVLLLALGGAMRRRRVWTYELEGARARLASLTRRWAAGAIDLILATGPVAAAYAVFLTSFSRIAENGPRDTLLGMKWIGVASLWALVALFALSFVEGRTGGTPGNWICGIRTVGVDLGRPGFGRALLRNLLVVIDGAFGFAVGILLIALTPNQQRLGDLAAKTVVVVLPRRGV